MRNTSLERLDADIARSRAQAEECLKQAERSMSQTDKKIWLGMAEKWVKLIEEAEQRRNISNPLV